MKEMDCGEGDTKNKWNTSGPAHKPEVPLFLFLLVLSGFQIPGHAATLNVPAQYATIQEAIDAAANGDEAVVAPGEYLENVQFHGKNITVRSQNPDNPAIVETTIINGNRTGSVVTFDGTEGPECLLAGFTITNGYGLRGGGVNGSAFSGEGEGESDTVGTRATIEKNWIIGNTAGPPGDGLYEIAGGGLYRCQGRISGNAIAGNDAVSGQVCWPGFPDDCSQVLAYCGGLHLCTGTIEANVIADNTGAGGAALYLCAGVISNNVIVNNHGTDIVNLTGGEVTSNVVANNSGNALAFKLGTGGQIRRNLIFDNGGIALWGSVVAQENLFSGGTGSSPKHYIRKCEVFAKNVVLRNKHKASVTGMIEGCEGVISNLIVGCTVGPAAIRNVDGLIANNTIVNNMATNLEGGAAGITACPNATIVNNILWGNRGPLGLTEQIHASAIPTYSCIENDTSGEPTNISLDPGFVDPAHGDFSLRPDSPCIDAGAYVAEAAFDIVGRARGFDGSPEPRGDGSDFDIGAYEFVMNIIGEGEGEGEGEGVGALPGPHDADQDADGHISMSELLRVIQFYNARAYHCAEGTEDGYAPGEDSPQRRGHGEGGEEFQPQRTERTQGTQGENRGLSQASESSSETGLSLISGESEWEFVNPLAVERSPIVAAYMKKHGIVLPEVPEEHIRLWKAWVTKQGNVRSSSFSLSSEDSLKAELRTEEAAEDALRTEEAAEDALRTEEAAEDALRTEDSLKAGLGTRDALKGALRTGCTYHSSDYAPQDWAVSITELLRTIQFFNTPGGYMGCDYGEDGYCPVVE